MLQIKKLSKSYRSQLLFNQVSFSLAQGERVGIVGRNGSGKSTLFKLILGIEQADDGEIEIPRGYTIGHLEQHLKFTKSTILEEAALGLTSGCESELYRAEIILSGLGFSLEDMQKSPETLSGGFQIRVNLAKLLLSKPNLLLLDEPTNYLDIVSARWLRDFLSSWPGEVMIITHDRSFMDSVTTHTMVIRRKEIRHVPGASVKLIEQLELEDEVYEKTRLNELKKREEIEAFVNRFRAKASKATQVQSKIKMLEKMPSKEQLQQEASLDFRFNEAPFLNKRLIEADGLSFGYDPDLAPLFDALSFTLLKGERLGIIGKNGKGKSTLLRALAGELELQKGSATIHQNALTGYFGQTNIARLNEACTVEEEIDQSNPSLHRTAVRQICGTMMFSGDDALKKISVLSGGEKSRVLIGKILASPTNLLLLDEPTNHLDIESVQALVKSLKRYEGGVVIVTHDEEILRELVTKLIVFKGDTVKLVEGNYDYFLRTEGWGDQISDAPSSHRAENLSKQKTPASPLTNKESRAKKKAMAKIERDICKYEELLKKAQVGMDKAVEARNTPDITALGYTINEIEEKIEAAFNELESISKDLE